MPYGMWDFSFPTRDQMRVPSAVKAQSLNYWTAREVLALLLIVKH